MAATKNFPRGIALVGAPDGDMASRDAVFSPVQAMQIEIPQDVIDQVLESALSGKLPQIFFGRTPQLKYGNKTHVLQSSTETYRHELYRSNGTAGDDDDDDDTLAFAGLINHSLTVQKAEDVTAGVDSALEQLRYNMAAISEVREANKTIVGDATSSRASGHRRFPSSGFKHLAPSRVGSPLLNTPSSPMHKRPPTSQPGSTHEAILTALRVPLIHLLAKQPATEASLAASCRTSAANVRDLLPKIAKRSFQETDKWQLTDKSFHDINPWKFPYSAEDRDEAIESAIKAFDRLRLAKDDKLWQILLPREERGQGKCLSRSKVKAVEAKPKSSTPMQKISDLTKKKAAPKKADDKVVERKMKTAKDSDIKPMKVVKAKLVRELPKIREVKVEPSRTSTTLPATTSATKPVATTHRDTPPSDPTKVRTKKAPGSDNNSTPRVRPKMSSRDINRNHPVRPVRPTMPINTKPKNPSPLSASPPVNASDFEDNHPVHKALAAAPSPAKISSGNSDRSLKRKANDIGSDIHNHSLALKKSQLDRSTPNHSSSGNNGRLNNSTPSSSISLKRKSNESSSSNTPNNTTKVRKINNIDTGLASRYHHNNSQASPGASSTSTTSPTTSLSFRQTVELSQKFQKYYKKYEELYWQLTEAEKPPTEMQRSSLLKMHKQLDEMKKEIKAGAGGMHR